MSKISSVLSILSLSESQSFFLGLGFMKAAHSHTKGSLHWYASFLNFLWMLQRFGARLWPKFDGLDAPPDEEEDWLAF